jgi:hypothetical protein
MKKLTTILFLAPLLFLSCQNQKSKTSEKNEVDIQTDTATLISLDKEISKSDKIEDDSILLNGFLGLLKIDTYSENKLIIQNADQSNFCSVALGQPESQDYYNYLDSIIAPFDLYIYKPDYNLFIIKCNLTKDFYEIKTKSGELKLISRDLNYCLFQTWTEFILSDNYVTIAGKNFSNSLKIFHEPTELSKRIGLEEDIDHFLLNAKSVKKDWVQINAESMDSDTIPSFSGWIKWRNEKELLIDFYFLM